VLFQAFLVLAAAAGSALAQRAAEVREIPDQTAVKGKRFALARQPFAPRTRTGYHTLTFSPDGKCLASIGHGNTLLTWDAASGKELRALAGHKNNVLDLAYSPDGKWIASAGQDGGKLWDAATGRLLFTTTGQSWVDRVAFSPDARRLATAGQPGIKIWEAATGKLLATFQSQRGWESTVAFSPDGNDLASGNIEKIVTIWDPATGRQRRSIRGHTGAIHTVAYSPDGKRLASASVDKTVRIWDPATGRELMCLTGHAGPVHTVAFSPNGRLLVTASSDRTARLWDSGSGRELLSLDGMTMPVYCAVFSNDGRRLAATANDGQVLIWLLAVPAGRAADLTPRGLEALWTDLAANDAARGFQAVFTLAAAPQHALPFLKKHLRAVESPPDQAARLARLVADLDNKRYAVRRKAAQALEQMGKLAEPTLKRVLEGKPSAEVRRQVDHLIDTLAGVEPSPEQRLAQRATEVLERIGTREARAQLERLAHGADGAWLTQEARASLLRLGRQP
jgi:dipeptidyl aminopeptidase/acylaminoacyl peptidase